MISSLQKSSLFATPSPFRGVRLIRSGDPDYPANLSGLEHHPEKLWVKGSLLPTDAFSVAIVGSRTCSELGKKRAYRLASQLATEGVSIVSGLARGIDAAAHRGALSAGGRTLAVLGTGFEGVSPCHDQVLAQAISQSGALVSQFDLCFTGSRKSYLKRNYVVSGLAQIVVVVEAQLHSGTANTLRQALAQGRPVGLLHSLVASQGWAAQLANNHPQVFTVRDCADVTDRLVRHEA